MKNLIKLVTMITLALGLSTQAFASGTGSDTEKNRIADVGIYNLVDGLAIKGHDPVAYFPEGGGKKALGDPSLSIDYAGVTYYFANEKNMDLFMDEANASESQNRSSKYEPTYGGWCAYAMSLGRNQDINPDLFDVSTGRLHLFATGTLGLWTADPANLERKADRQWTRKLRNARRGK